MKEESWRRTHGGGIMEDELWKRNHGRGNLKEEASGSIRGYLGGIWEASMKMRFLEASGAIWEASGKHLGGIQLRFPL